MKRTMTAVGVVLGAMGILVTTTTANAQQSPEFGQRGEFIIGVDRLMPLLSYSHDSVDFTQDNVKTTISTSQWSMSWFYGGTGDPDLAYTVPRLGFDYAVANNVTVGGNLLLFYTMGANQTTKTEGNDVETSTTVGQPNTVLFGIAPRAGYIFRFSNMLGLWLRGGFTLFTQTSSATSNPTDNTSVTNKTSETQFSLNLEPQIVFTPLPHVGLTAGLAMDIPLAGSATQEQDTTGPNESTVTKVNGGAHDFYLGLLNLGMFVDF